MRPTTYKNYLLVVLTVIVLFNFVDRVALGIVLQDIKTDLQLSDTQLGFLSGIAFALFYSIMGIPIARWADRGDRVVIISLTAVLWSVAVALCGIAGSFVQLLLIRVAVAVGEAGCMPPAFSLIADYFNRAERPRAFSIYQIGGALSFVVGFFLAGWLNELYGWRVTFMLLGLPGVVLAAVAWFTLREPRRIKPVQEAALPEAAAARRTPQPTLKEVCATLWANVTFRHLLLCYSVLSLFGYGIFQWQATFFIRSYGFTSREIGVWLAVTCGLGALVGTCLGGVWTCRYAANNERLQLKVMATVIAASTLLLMFAYASRNPYWALGLIGLYVLNLYVVCVPLFSTIQTVVPGQMRAISIALIYLAANLIGMGLGPLTAGALSDAFRPWAGEESLRYALLILASGHLWGAWHAWRARRSVAFDLPAVQVDYEEGAVSKTGGEVHAAIRYPPLVRSASGDVNVTPALRPFASRIEGISDATD